LMEQSSSMKIKSYFADSVEQAIQDARQELGTDAMLITSRRSSPETRSLGAYEVVFGLHAASNSPGMRPRSGASASELSKDLSRDLSGELQNLRAQLQEIKCTLQGARGSDPGTSEADELVEELVSGDLARSIAQEIVSAAVRLRDQIARDQPPSFTPLRSYAAELISKRLQFAPHSLAAPHDKTATDGTPVVAFVGPPGAGKTTTLIKIAIRDYLAQRQPVRILSVDPYRVAAHEKLRSFAAIIGVTFTAVNSLPEFQAALEEARNKSVVLVDTPGYGLAEMDGAREIASCLARLALKQVHLVLPASMKRADLTRAIRGYAVFEPDYLLFTKLDETESQGAILSAALEAAKPMSFFGNGQNIPEDIEPAQARVLLASVFQPEIAEAVSAA
jgi:flagellar biosynthesis protein FlhF